MERYIHSNNETLDAPFSVADVLKKIVSITYSDDAEHISPRDFKSSKTDCSKLDREQLLSSPEYTSDNIL